MERIFVSLLFLSAWRSSSSLPRQYHYVADPMTWTEAQTYCRDTYIDLATVDNADDNDNLYSMVSSLHSGTVWIGMYHQIKWKWSDGYKESGADYRAWEPSTEPNFVYGDQYCGQVRDEGGWFDDYCHLGYSAVCYNGTPENPEYFLVKANLDWSSAQSYCRQNYKDLATVKNDAQNQKVKDLTHNITWSWIGLYREPDYAWSDGAISTYANWGGFGNTMGNNAVLCVAVDMRYWGFWKLEPCDTKHPFVCNVSPSEKQVVKLKFKAEDSVDMNDPAVKAQILKQLQGKLKEDGLSGLTLRWREQPDGKVFHKEETCPQKKGNENTLLCE